MASPVIVVMPLSVVQMFQGRYHRCIHCLEAMFFSVKKVCEMEKILEPTVVSTLCIACLNLSDLKDE